MPLYAVRSTERMAYHVPTDTPSPWPRLKAAAQERMAQDPALTFPAAIQQALEQTPALHREEAPAIVYYRRLTLLEWRALQLKHTANGVMEWGAITQDITTMTVVGWEQYVDPVTDAVIDFERLSSDERTQEILALPMNVQMGIAALAQQTIAERDTARKNFSAGLSASTP